MNTSVRLGQIGIGGFGQSHLSTLRTLQRSGACELVAVADPFASRHPETVAGLRSSNVTLYEEFGELLARDDLDAVIIATPIPLHFPQALAALQAGKHVYLEKPPCVTLEQLATLKAAQKRSGKICVVGFQQQSTPGVQFLKSQLVHGAIGKLQAVWACVRWQRSDSYYNRSPWAGKWTHDGAPVFDGPATNALSHVVHSALFLSGAELTAWGEIVRVRGTLKKARPVESYDSVFLEAETSTGVLVRLAFTHASSQQDEVVIRCQGEDGEACSDWKGGVFIQPRGKEGERFNFRCEAHFIAMLDYFRAINNPMHRPATVLEDCLSYLQTVNAGQESSQGAKFFEADNIERRGEGTPGAHYTVKGLDEEMSRFALDWEAIPALLHEPENTWIPATI